MRCSGILFNIGRCVEEIREKNATGSVIGIFSTSLYIGYQKGNILLIYAGDYGYIPFGAQIKKEELDRLKTVICLGMQVCVRQADMIFDANEAVLEMKGTWFMDDGVKNDGKGDVKGTKTYDISGEAWKRARAFLAEDTVTDGLGGMVRCIEMICTDAGVPCTCKDKIFCRYAAPWIKGLADSRHVPDRNRMERCISHLLGLGIGLTPSGDDFLTGFCYGILRLGNMNLLYKKDLQECIIRLGPVKTTPISNAYVRASAMGQYYQVLENALDALCGREDVYRAFGSLLRVGNSSGREMGLGLLFSAFLSAEGQLNKGGA